MDGLAPESSGFRRVAVSMSLSRSPAPDRTYFQVIWEHIRLLIMNPRIQLRHLILYQLGGSAGLWPCQASREDVSRPIRIDSQLPGVAEWQSQ
jgi:hypothetical protein